MFHSKFKKANFQALINRWYWFLVGLCLAILFAISSATRLPLLLVGTVPFMDFDAYFQMTREISDGIGPYQVSVMQTAGPPLVILPYFLTLGMSNEIGRGVMTTISVLASIAASWLLSGKLSQRYRVLTTLLLIIGIWITFPARFTVMMGQSNLLVMLLVTILLTTKGRWQSVSLAIMTIIKTNYLIVWPFLWRRPRVLALALVLVLCVAMAGLYVIPMSAYEYYVTQRLQGYLNVESPPQHMDYYNQSLQSTLARVDARMLYPLVLGGLLLLMVWLAWKTSNPAFGIVFAILLSPLVWQHYCIVLYPILILLAWQHRTRLQFLAGIFISYLLLMTNWHWLHTIEPNTLTGIIGSHQFLGILLLLMLLIWSELGAKVELLPDGK